MRTVGVLVLCGMLAGCASGKPPAAGLPDGLPDAWTGRTTVAELPVASSLLGLMREPELGELVREALVSNPDLGATAKRLEAQGFLLGLARARMLPSVGVTPSGERGDLGGVKSDVWRVGLGVGWELDLWGKLADERGAAEGEWRAVRQDWLAARDALATRVIQHWVEKVVLARAVHIEQERGVILGKAEDLVLQRYRDGTGSLDELSAARSRAAIARADLSERQAALNECVRGLEVLLGRRPAAKLLGGGELPMVEEPSVGIPAETLLNRPDVRAGLARVEAARLRVRSARKEKLPTVKLSGEVFRETATLGGLGGAASQWDLLGSLFQPLFEGGRIRSTVQARESEADAALLELHAVVLKALKEVEDALDLERRLLEQTTALAEALSESETNSRFHVRRYRQGLGTLQDLLAAREQETAVRLQLGNARGRQLINRIDLALALGSGAGDME